MRRTNILFVLLLFLISIFMIFILIWYTIIQNIPKNGFTRKIATSLLKESRSIDIKYDSYYIAGLTTKKIYLGNTTAPLHLLASNYILSDTHHLNIKVQSGIKILWNAVNISMDSSNIYMTEGVTPQILYSKTDELGSDKSLTSIHTKFSAITLLSPSSYALRIYDILLNQNILIKGLGYGKDFHTVSSHVLEKQIDGLFCTDGMFEYDHSGKSLVYIYFYRNEFICLDTNLNLKYKGHTIDTISHARIKMDTVRAHQMVTFSQPPLTVNKKSSVYNNRLLIYSLLKADNEDQKSHDKNATIDVYDLNNGHYLYSFYLPDFKKEKVKDFRIFKNILVAIYGNYLVTWDIDLI